MIRQADIQRGIANYGFWRAELRGAIATGRANMTPAEAEKHHACEFGQWFYALPEADRSDPRFAAVEELHRRVHREAAGVLRLVEAGHLAQATRELDHGSNFDNACRQLTRSLIDWSKAA